MDKAMLQRIRAFAEYNFCLPEDKQVYVEDTEFYVTNPWIDKSARFPLTDDQAVQTWGLDVVMEFCAKAIGVMENGLFPNERTEEDPVLRGFVWRHGSGDYSVHVVDLTPVDISRIETILNRYDTEGYSERNCYKERICDIFPETDESGSEA